MHPIRWREALAGDAVAVLVETVDVAPGERPAVVKAGLGQGMGVKVAAVAHVGVAGTGIGVGGCGCGRVAPGEEVWFAAECGACIKLA